MTNLFVKHCRNSIFVWDDEKKIGTYIHKLNKELATSLPNKDFGVSIGYSMILSEQTTIDDAINDSLEMIHKSKVK